jgi:3-hydroxybutyrate dehydrogenase
MPSPLPLSGKTAIVTGSTSGIGLGIATALAASGAQILLNGFGDATEIETLRKHLSALHGVKVAYSGANLMKVDEIEAMIAYARQELGEVDILVNNAGIQFVSPIEDFPVEKFDQIIALNMAASWHATRLTFKSMKDRGWGRIVNIASAHALVASPFKSAYVMAKHGIAGLTKTIALEGAEHGVTVNAICPGYVKTPLVEKQIPDTAKARGMTEDQVIREVILDAQPTKKFVTVEEVAGLAVYLCGETSASINGAILSIDGGWTAQ